MRVLMWSLATAYHPQTNGLDERWNQTLQTAPRKVIDPENQDDWDEHLELSAYRAMVHDLTWMSPYIMVYHKEPRLPVDIEHGQSTDQLEELTSTIIHDAETYQRYCDKRHMNPTYAIGTKVLLKNVKGQQGGKWIRTTQGRTRSHLT